MKGSSGWGVDSGPHAVGHNIELLAVTFVDECGQAQRPAGTLVPAGQGTPAWQVRTCGARGLANSGLAPEQLLQVPSTLPGAASSSTGGVLESTKYLERARGQEGSRRNLRP